MSDCISAGKALEAAMKVMETECSKAKNKKHYWEDAAYSIKQCKLCDKIVYTK